MKEYEDKYIDYILDSRGNEVKIVFIGFLLSINLAFFAGLYYINNKFPFCLSDLQILVLFLLVAINILFSCICIRENNLDRTITRYVKEEFIENKILSTNESELKNVINKIINTENGENTEDWENPKKWHGKSWLATIGLLVIVNAVPLSTLIWAPLSWLCWSHLPYRAIIFSIITLLIGLIVFLTIRNYDLREKKS